MSALAELLAKVEAAAGPDRTLDSQVWCAAMGVPWRPDRSVYDPPVTASVDDALMLVGRSLPGVGVEVGYPARLGKHSGQPWADVWAGRDDPEHPWDHTIRRPTARHSNAATPALAILAALLKALIAKEAA